MGAMTGFRWPWSRRAQTPPPRAARVRGGAMTFDVVWPDPDATTRDEVKGLWERLRMLPPGAQADERAAQLCIVGRVDGQLAAVSTAEITLMPRLRHRLAMVRAMVHPGYRSVEAILGLIRSTHATLEAWSAAHPEAGVMGLAVVLENRQLAEMLRYPGLAMREGDPPWSGLVLIGYTDKNEQIRVSWFRHARVDTAVEPGQDGAGPTGAAAQGGARA